MIFIEIKLGDLQVKGLLDSGSSISILGKDCQEIKDRLKLEIIPVFVGINSAEGKEYN